MRITITILTTVLLVAVAPSSAQELQRGVVVYDDLQQESNEKSFTQSILDKLDACGLDSEKAQALVESSIAHFSNMKTEIERYMEAVGSVDYKAIVDDVSKSLMYAKEVDFCNYDYLVGLSQRLGVELTQERLEKVQKLCNTTGRPLDI